MKKTNLILLLLLTIFLLGCSSGPFGVHKIEVQQGTVVTAEQFTSLQVGMSQAQVLQLLGSPIQSSVFNSNVWNYQYTLRDDRNSLIKKGFSVLFEEEKIAEILGEIDS